ncbi:hypothetical protein [Micromonospora sp. NPDC005174]|uniref:hypothetical protein n=1 Tax=unclassified Micromonospora TaxID=2617518 RepID=UPI0033A9283F
MRGWRHPAGTIATTAGVALLGGGLSLLDSTGALARLGGWLAHLIAPTGQRADG